MLRQSDDPEERSLADVVSAISSLKNSLAKLEDRMSFESLDFKIFNEISETIDNLPRKVAKELSNGPRNLRKGRIVDPFVIRELTHMLPSKSSSGPIAILVVLSFYRDQFPWLYELGLEAYRRASSGDIVGARDVIKDLQMMAEMSLKGPLMDELFGSRKEAYMLMEELPFLLERVVDESMMSK